MSEKITATYNEYSMDALVVEYSDTADLNIIDHVHEEPLRRALNARHKERKAAKKAECRFALARSTKPGEWWVMDCDDNDAVVAIFPKSNSAEADARATSKLLNKRNRKPMGGERDG